MKDMIDHSLADVKPQLAYPQLQDGFQDSFFAGHIIKNRYDEERLVISKKFNTSRFSFPTNNGDYHLYGLVKQASPNHKLISSLNKKKTINIGEYGGLLTSNGLSCLTCFLHFSPGMYPLDSIYMNHFFPEVDDTFNEHNNSIPTFQRLGTIYLFTLVNHNKQ